MESSWQGKDRSRNLTLYKDIGDCLEVTKLGPDIESRFKLSIKECADGILSTHEIVDCLIKIIASEKEGWIIISQPFTSLFPFPYKKLERIRVSGSEYLMANLDVLDAWKRGEIASWIDHLLTSGLNEFIQGTRSLSLSSLATDESVDSLSVAPIIIVINDGEWFEPESLRKNLGIQHDSKQDIYIYDSALNTVTYIANGNSISSISELALMASLCSRPIILVKYGSTLSNWTISQAESLKGEMDKKVVLYGDYILETAVDNKVSIIRGKPFTSISLFEVDISHGVLATTPLSLIGYNQPAANNRDVAWQELLSYAYTNGAEFRHKQCLFGKSKAQSNQSNQIRHAHYNYSFLINPDTWVKNNDFERKLERLSQASIDRAIQLIDDGINTQIVDRLTSTDVTILIPCDNQNIQINTCVQLLLNRKDIPNIRIQAALPCNPSTSLTDSVNSLEHQYGRMFSFFVNNNGNHSNSELINAGVSRAGSEYILLMEPDIEVRSDYAISEMVTYTLLYHAGIAGARLLAPSGLIHHDGLAISYSKSIAVVSPGSGYFEEQIDALCPVQSAVHECTAVSEAFMLIKRRVFHEIGGFSEELSSESNAVDFCLRGNLLEKKTLCVTRPMILKTSKDLSSFSCLRRAEKLADKKLLVERNPFFFSIKDAYNYGELLDNSILSQEAGKTTISECGLPIQTSEVFRWHSDKGPKKRLASIFVHYDTTGNASNDVLYYLRSLSELTDVFFVSASVTLAENKLILKQLKELCQTIVIRTNSGYDFGCWAHIINKYREEIIDSYDALILCNDSVIGPIYDLEPILNSFVGSGADYCGLTASTAPAWHLQSYFIMYARRLLVDPIFNTFWSNIREQPTKNAVIYNYEVNWNALLMRHGFLFYVHFENYVNAENNTHLKWKELLQDGYPFIKKDLIHSNPLGVSIADLDKVVASYNASLGKIVKSYQLKFHAT